MGGGLPGPDARRVPGLDPRRSVLPSMMCHDVFKGSIVARDQRLHRQPPAPLRVLRGPAELDDRVRDEWRGEAEGVADDLRAEEGGAHPAGVEAAIGSGEEEILDRRAE